jgi:hypothetical protein
MVPPTLVLPPHVPARLLVSPTSNLQTLVPPGARPLAAKSLGGPW